MEHLPGPQPSPEALAGFTETAPEQTQRLRRQTVLNTVTEYEPYDGTAGVTQLRKDIEYIRRLNTPGQPPPPNQHELIRERIQTERQAVTEQQAGIGRTINGLFNHVHSQPDAPLPELWSAVSEAAPVYRFTEEQLGLFYDGLQLYRQTHDLVTAYRTQTPDDAKLFQTVFGFAPTGQVRVETGPMSLNFHCDNEEDYTVAYNGKISLDQVEPATAIRTRGSLGGALAEVRDSRDHPLAGAVTLYNNPAFLRLSPDQLQQKTLEQYKAEVEEHEESHLFLEIINRLRSDQTDPKAADLISPDMPPDQIVQLLAKRLVLQLRRPRFDDPAQQEILAYLQTGTPLDSIRRRLTLSPSYNYRQLYASYIDKLPAYLVSRVKTTLDNTPEAAGMTFENGAHGLDQATMKQVADQTFGPDYQTDLNQWLQAVQTMQSKGYTDKQIVTYFYAQPINQWPSLATHAQAITT